MLSMCPEIYGFDKAIKLATERENSNSIGMLGEKTLHSVLKYMFCEDDTKHEIKHCGFVADVLIDGGERPVIFEIQTKQIYKLRRKLQAYKDADVNVVLPAIREKEIIWKDTFEGRLSAPHGTSRPKNVFNKIAEMYALRDFIENENVSFIVPVLRVREYRLLDGRGKDKKKGATKLDVVPEALFDVVRLNSKEDFYKLLPYSSGDIFNSSELAKITGINTEDARKCILVYKQLGILEECGKKDRKKLWTVIY